MTAASHFFINGSAHTQEDFVRSACDPKRSVVVEAAELDEQATEDRRGDQEQHEAALRGESDAGAQQGSDDDEKGQRGDEVHGGRP